MNVTIPVTEKIDAIHALIETLPAVETPVTHRFTPGLYIREIFVPKGTILVTKIHRTEHPFALMGGKAVVWSEHDGTQKLQAPFLGITKPGTRRVIFVQEDVVWATFHPTELVDPDEIEREIIEPHEAKPLSTEMVRKVLSL